MLQTVSTFRHFASDRYREAFSEALLRDITSSKTALSAVRSFIKEYKHTMTKSKGKPTGRTVTHDKLNWVEVNLTDADKEAIRQAGDDGLPDLLGAIGLVLHDSGNLSIKPDGNGAFRATIIWTSVEGKVERKFGISSVSPYVQYAIASVLHKYLVVLGGADEPPTPDNDETPLFT